MSCQPDRPAADKWPGRPETRARAQFSEWLATQPQADDREWVAQANRVAVGEVFALEIPQLLSFLVDNRALLDRPLDPDMMGQIMARSPISLGRLLRELYMLDVFGRLLALVNLNMGFTAAGPGSEARE
jgi:hypothetical protein